MYVCFIASKQVSTVSVELQVSDHTQPYSDVQPSDLSVFSDESQTSSSHYDEIVDPPAESSYLALMYHPEGEIFVMLDYDLFQCI